jgi:hypothetical protein
MQNNPGQVRELDQHAELRPFSELNLKRVYGMVWLFIQVWYSLYTYC